MKSVKVEMALLEERRRRADDLAQQAKDIYTEIMQEWNGIAQRIRDGETTGDPLKDFIVARYFSFDDEVEERYRALQAKFKDFRGQYIMLVRVGKEPIHPHSEKLIERTELCVGVLNGDSFILDPPKALFWFPTGDKSAVCYDRLDKEPANLREQNLTLPLLEDMGLKTSPELQILVGDEEVTNWFAHQLDGKYFEVFCKFNVAFDRSVSYPSLKVYLVEKRTEWLTSYAALKAKKTWLEAECRRLKRVGVNDSNVVNMEREIGGIPHQMELIQIQASKLGIYDVDWENAMAV
jgi:hypothetical protein